MAGLCFGAEAGFPNGGEWLPVAAIGGFERGEIPGPAGFRFGGEFHPGEIQAAQQFGQEKADGASIEIAERMDAEETAFREGKKFEGEIDVATRGVGPAGLKIEHVVPHQHGHLMRGGWSERADGDFNGAPFASPLGGEVATESGVEFGQEAFIERTRGEGLGQKIGFQTGDALGEKGS